MVVVVVAKKQPDI